MNRKIKKYLLDEMENLFKSLKKQKRLYDVMVLFSGGKDSTILLKMVREKYGLNPLAVSVIHPPHCSSWDWQGPVRRYCTGYWPRTPPVAF